LEWIVSALGTLVGTATGQAWKVATAVLAGLLLVVGVAGGTALWLQDRALTQAHAELKAEQGVSAELRTGIGAQNAAIGKLGQEKLEADARGTAARAQAAEQGKHYDNALQQIAAARGTSCEDVMPAVNQLWEAVR
jgi:hypothetical protein